jgi:NADH-quinone oxidoreductase subunit G
MIGRRREGSAMAKIIIDEQEFECRDGINVLQAALESGFDVPHYCYHPGLKVVASCRLCLMEMKLPHPKTQEMGWAPKLFPSCQTPVKNGMEVRFNSDPVKSNVEHTMEYFLVNHPLDCPVCDQAGECYLQDYSYKFGRPTSRMVDQKTVTPKKNLGPNTLLYSDRCVMCTRCVRFTEEISGTSELCIINRGNHTEIDVFPGIPLDNKLQGNVVDICPVGCLLDKDFLFQQRVWVLEGADSICPGCSTGCAIRVDQNENTVHRLKPRYNPGVNDWWMCDEGRFGWKYVKDPKRIRSAMIRRGNEMAPIQWEQLHEIAEFRFRQQVDRGTAEKVACVLSPMMASEEAWLLASFIRKIAPQAALVIGPVFTNGRDESFPIGAKPEDAKFTIRAEKCPNARGVQAVADAFGGNTLPFEEFVTQCAESAFNAAWIVGGYPTSEWADKDLDKATNQLDLLLVQDILPNALTEKATIVLPQCAWTERSGSFTNHAGLIQPFEAAVAPPDGAKRDGQYLFEIAGHRGIYSGQRVREWMAETMPAFAEISEPPAKPAHQH